jgi:hypothetical protein
MTLDYEVKDMGLVNQGFEGRLVKRYLPSREVGA